MTDQQYTPTTDLVSWWYVLVDHSGNKSSEEYEAEFNRWLASIEAAAEQRGAARGWDEGYAASDEESYYFSTHGCTPNPYRADQEGVQDA